MDAFRIFIVEDDPWYADLIRHTLALNPDFELEKFASGRECLAQLYKKPSLVTVDVQLPDMDGKELLKKIRGHSPETAVLIISGQEDINTAVELLKEGAFDYIVKDENTRSRLWNAVRLFRENHNLRVENDQLWERVGKKFDFSNILIGDSKGIRKAFSMMEKAVTSQITVSVTGETGTGKELVAKAIHYNSDRRKFPFVAVNIGAIPADLVESELFGYEKGAFTGAMSRRTGYFEDAHRGTLFLDEIAEMDLNMQTRFLRVLQEREVRRIGSSQPVKIDVRVITATHKNLVEEVNKGNFRSDLFYRLMGLPIHLVPLRERGNDIMKLALHFAETFCRENKRQRVTFSEEAVSKLMGYNYPGNVRELKAVIELAIILCEEGVIRPQHISFAPVEAIPGEEPQEVTLDEHIRRIVKRSLRNNDHNPTQVARELGISRPTVYRYMKEMSL
jgi:DNA-binding NtrC family response regulator